MTSSKPPAGQTPALADLLVLGGSVLTIDPADTVSPEGAVAIRTARIVAARNPNALPAYHPDSQLVYATRAEAVQTLIVDGKILMERRRLRALDPEIFRRHSLPFARRIGRDAGRRSPSA